MDTNLEAALRTIIDRQEIVEVVTRYARGIDRGDRELVRSAYHDDALEDHGTARGDFIGNPDEFVAWSSGRGDAMRSCLHYLTNQTVELDGDTAHAETYFLAMIRAEDSDRVSLSGGRYLDRLERRGGKWRIYRRVVVGEWNSEVDSARFNPLHVGRRDRTDLSYSRPLEATRSPSRS